MNDISKFNQNNLIQIKLDSMRNNDKNIKSQPTEHPKTTSDLINSYLESIANANRPTVVSPSDNLPPRLPNCQIA